MLFSHVTIIMCLLFVVCTDTRFASFQVTTMPRNCQLIQRSKGTLQCEQCNKSFVSMAGYQKHMNAHQGIFRYQCETCNRGYNSSTNYKEHLSTHTGLNYFPCDSCGESFRNFRQMHVHKSICKGNI